MEKRMARLDRVDDDDYEIIDRGDEMFHQIKLTKRSPYPGVLFQFGKVNLSEENDSLRVKFDYEVFENRNNLDTRSEKFVDYIGNILMTNLSELLLYNSVTKVKEQDG
jgi:uncharacterized protein YutD